MPGATISAQNFRRLRSVRWAPSGVCLLCGANGAGKTTSLDMLLFVRTLFELGLESALETIGGEYLRSADVPESEPVVVEVGVGDVRWKLRFPASAAGIKGLHGEELYRGEALVLRANMFDDGWFLGSERKPRDEVRCCAKVLYDDRVLRGEELSWMTPLEEALTGIRVYKSYRLNLVQRPDRSERHKTFLHGTGKNLWAVLANWKAAEKRYRGQFEWVLSAARAAFPGLIASIDLSDGPLLYAPRATPEQGLPPQRAAEGLLTGFLHLTAVAGARPGSILAFDEIENQLHPHAIRSILSSMRALAEERGLTIILTTHSPVVMNEFRDDPEHVYVLESTDGEPVPAPILALHSEEWLAQAKLGTLYERLAFAAPATGEPPS